MVVIDARKAMDAGIGTYIKELVPRVCDAMPDVNFNILASTESLAWVEKISRNEASNITYKILDALPFSISEQLLLRRHLNHRSLFWATSLAHPLFYNGPYITTIHDVAQLALPRSMAGGILTKAASRIYFKSILENSRELLFVSEFSRSEFSRYVGKPKQRTSVIHLGVDSKWFDSCTKLPKIDCSPYFISVSSIRPHKNFSFLLSAFLSIANSIPHNLVIAGDKRGLNNMDPALMKEVMDLGSRIQFLGRISDEDLKIWVSNAEAMIFPSLYEGFGLPPVEAMAAGCPVITSSSTAMKEVCGNAVIYFNPLELKSLVSALLSFSLMDRSSREHLKEMGKVKALEYDWSIAAQNTVKVIRQSLTEVY